ncbi:hypothetical protein NDU88_001715 [Pleurodeles waltl]|uniref:Uncharacterized protein n=1 Tax=Pleurodeles waltl TaxID=8319 RepID=A0AAV7WNH6_PLEWA|nr:hypothetical protein NDU88_001715 [Pleurodeles waltl]
MALGIWRLCRGGEQSQQTPGVPGDLCGSSSYPVLVLRSRGRERMEAANWLDPRASGMAPPGMAPRTEADGDGRKWGKSGRSPPEPEEADRQTGWITLIFS